jgi:hypothetical protein
MNVEAPPISMLSLWLEEPTEAFADVWSSERALNRAARNTLGGTQASDSRPGNGGDMKVK